MKIRTKIDTPAYGPKGTVWEDYQGGIIWHAINWTARVNMEHDGNPWECYPDLFELVEEPKSPAYERVEIDWNGDIPFWGTSHLLEHPRVIGVEFEKAPGWIRQESRLFWCERTGLERWASQHQLETGDAVPVRAKWAVVRRQE